jgi:NAD+ kinase
MSTTFKKITLMAPAKNTEIQDTLTTLITFLQAQKIAFNCEKNTLKLLPHALKKLNFQSIEQETLGEDCDLIIVIGGDGSILRAAQNAARHKTPIIGINRGRLGFLTDLRAHEIETRLAAVLRGEYEIKERFFLETQNQYLALNDIVISSGRAPHMLEFEIYINEEFVCSERADGLILSTPTGSTAYSLSAGGPIVHPSIDGIVILPMFSHTLSTRPIIVPGDSQIRVKLASYQKTGCKLTCDGSEISSIAQGEEISIHKHPEPMRMAHPLDYSYYENLRSKLYWGQKLTTPNLV